MTVAAVGEFSAFIRELFIESVQTLALASQQLELPTQELIAALASRTSETLTNPWPDQIARLFRGIGMTGDHAFWQTPEMRGHVPNDRNALKALVELRNSLAHGGADRVTLKNVERASAAPQATRPLDRSGDWSLHGGSEHGGYHTVGLELWPAG